MSTVIIENQEFTYQQLEELYNLPKNVTIDGPRVIANDQDNKAIKILNYMHFLNCFPIDGLSSKSYKVLAEAMISFDMKNIDVFSSKIDEDFLASINFGQAKTKLLLEGLQKWRSKGIDLWRLIYAINIDGCGKSTAVEYAKYLAGVDYSFAGKTKAIIRQLKNRFTLGDVQSFESLLNIQIILPVEQAQESDEDAILYVMTGSPKSFGFSTKAKFKESLPSNWKETSKIKEAAILITDNMESKSSKMKAAEKLGLQIKTYGTVTS